MKVSVIVPVYNVKQYLARCIKSILCQSFTDLELILVDDGSTDGCGEICDNYAIIDSRIQVIHQNNAGLSAARNTGLNHASGEYIYFVDSDDFISPVLLEKCVEAIDGNDMVAFNYYCVDEIGKCIGKPTNFHAGTRIWNNEDEKVCYCENDFFLYTYLGWNVWMRLFRRDIIEQHRLRFVDNKIIYAEDIYFCYCYVLHCKSIVCIEDILYFYTQRISSIMSEQYKNQYMNMNRLNELSKSLYKYLCSCEGLTLMKKRFPLVHMNIIHHAFDRLQNNIGEIHIFKKRSMILEYVMDIVFFNNQAQGIIKNKRELYKIYGFIDCLQIIRDWRYYLTGNKCLYQISFIIIFPYKAWKKITRSFN